MKTLSTSDINVRNKAVWAVVSSQFHEAMTNPKTAKAAMALLENEWARGVPLRNQMSFERACRVIETVQRETRQQLAQSGGRSRRTRDELTRRIMKIVRRSPSISARELLRKLQGDDGAGVIKRIESPSEGLGGKRLIHYVADNGSEKSASVGSLKDRLSRVKKLFARTS